MPIASFHTKRACFYIYKATLPGRHVAKFAADYTRLAIELTASS
jgi:hypothetical protein